MRLREFASKPEVDLFEINMRPKNLEQLASQIQGVRVGMEFEMCVPRAGEREQESEPEREREDEDTRSFRHIENFFMAGNNSRYSVSRLMDKLEDRWRGWTANQIELMWDKDKKEFISDYLYNNDVDGAKGMSDEEFEELVDKTLDYSDENYSTIFDEYSELKYDELTEEEFLEDEGLETMLDVYNEYDHIVDWPYWTEPENISSPELSGEDVAEGFSRRVGVNAVYSTGRYRNVNKTDWRVEPDGSISTDDDDTDAGLEFVTPDGGLPLDVMLEKMDLVKKWADDTGCYTNSSTGLHISVSVPNFSRLTVDYVKLVLLLGDNYVLDVFNRSSNTYAQSSFDYVNRAVRNKPNVIPEIFDKMRRYLAHLGAQSIASANTGKYFSVNFKDKYIEFRSPGGDWLDDKFWNEVKPTMLRFIVALDAASNPNKYREEYLKKLYKLLEKHTQKQGDITQLFAKYVAGEIPRSALVRFVRQAQTGRNVARGVASGQKYWWKVELPGSSYGIEVVGKGAEEAKQRALDSTPEWVRQGVTAGRLRATPVRPYDLDTQRNELEPGNETEPRYEIYNSDNPNQVIGMFYSLPGSATAVFRQYLRNRGISPDRYGFRQVTAGRLRATPVRPYDLDTQRNELEPGNETEPRYEIYNSDNPNQVIGMFYSLPGSATAVFRQYLRNRGISPDRYGFRQVTS